VGLKMGGQMVKSVRFVEYQGFVRQSTKGLQTMVDALEKQCRKYGMKIDCYKTKIMRIQGKRSGSW
jgi:hypothetical protein